MAEHNLYEREQLAAKLQNLKTQFRNRKIAIDEGKENKNSWKWFAMMEDLSQLTSYKYNIHTVCTSGTIRTVQQLYGF